MNLLLAGAQLIAFWIRELRINYGASNGVLGRLRASNGALGRLRAGNGKLKGYGTKRID